MAQRMLANLTRKDCELLLASARVGRIGISIGAMPAILPVNFVMYGDDIVFRTAAGTKFTAAVLGCVVAFQVDEFDAVTETGWSVMAVGRAVEATDPEMLSDISALPLHPWAGGEKDHVVLIRVEQLTGRRIISADSPTPAV